MYVTPGLTDMYVCFYTKSADLEFWKIHTGDRLIAAGVTGISLHDEIRIMTENGFDNLEALQAATLNPSKVLQKMGVERKRGMIESGYEADLIFTTVNPLEDLSVLRAPVMVMKSGELYNEDILTNLR